MSELNEFNFICRECMEEYIAESSDLVCDSYCPKCGTANYEENVEYRSGFGLTRSFELTLWRLGATKYLFEHAAINKYLRRRCMLVSSFKGVNKV